MNHHIIAECLFDWSSVCQHLTRSVSPDFAPPVVFREEDARGYFFGASCGMVATGAGGGIDRSQA